MHPEMAEPIIDQLVFDYVNAGLKLRLAPDWAKFRALRAYGSGCAKFTKAEMEKAISKAELVDLRKAQPIFQDNSPICRSVIQDYVNICFAVELAADWDEFRSSHFYQACIERFTKDEADEEIRKAKEDSDKLNSPLSP